MIAKPRDNSGSRGVILCRNAEELSAAINEALQYSKLETILVEEFIEGLEYSIEALHYDGKSEVIQFTEKTTTDFPYNVELGHKQPANLSEEQKDNIKQFISKIADCMHFENCASHTELKINDRGIYVIETSPRLGGDYITSTLVPLSTGINIEDQLLNIALENEVDTQTGRVEKASAVCFFNFPEGEVKYINPEIYNIKTEDNVFSLDIKLAVGDKVNKITSSLDRYGQVIFCADAIEQINYLVNDYSVSLSKMIDVI